MKKLAILLPLILLSSASCNRNWKSAPYPTGHTPCIQASRLAGGFDNPPDDCRPLTWWHWMNGNVTEDGVRKDLEWMHSIGIGGVFLFDAGNFKKQIVEERLPYMSEGWKSALRLSLDIADSLGMFFGIASSPGWSITGGPWVSEEDAQKKLVWSETAVTGGGHVSIGLPQPDSHITNAIGSFDWYRDICVLAVRKPAVDTTRILHSDVKAGFVMNYQISDRFPTPPTGDCTSLSDVLDISGNCSGGILDWDAPQGEWTIFRMGYALEGHVNGPATPESTGLEVDKLDRDAVGRYYDNYFGLFSSAVDPEGNGGPEALKGRIDAVEIDSYESGRATWTTRMEEEFAARRGYSLRPWMPVLTGRIIGSAEMSERFLFDWRKTLGELIAENHYDSATEIFHPLGIRRFSESHEERTAFIGDGMAVKRSCDVPMSAFWVRFNAGWYSSYPTSEADVRESSSVAHIYGQNICAAESFTTNGFPGKWDGYYAYQCTPARLKRVGDAALACGLNRFVIHTSVHQPLDNVVPGLALDRYGQWFNRHDTWSGEARPWMDYLARSSYMLRAGKWCADIAYFYGEDKNITGRFMHERPEIPAGWNYDFVNADVLTDEFSVRSGALVTRTGMRYSALRIDPEVRFISRPVLEAIAGFARAGVQIYGPRPERCADLESLVHNADSDIEFAALVDEIWALPNVHQDGFEMSFTGLAPDVMMADGSALTDSVKFVHRRLRGADIYWIANNCATPREIDLSLRSASRHAEIWHPDTGLREPARLSRSDGRSIVHLQLTRDDAQFVILYSRAKDASVHGETCSGFKTVSETPVCGPWNVSFKSAVKTPGDIVVSSVFNGKFLAAGEDACCPCGALATLDMQPDPDIRYFSGTATYRTTFSFDASSQVQPSTGPDTGCQSLAGPSGGRCAVLDLGAVYNMAHVVLNGKDLGLLWKEPFQIDVTDALVTGENILEIRVTNSWANRLIGDEIFPEGRTTFTPIPYYDASSPLPPSGLSGPVRIIQCDTEVID